MTIDVFEGTLTPRERVERALHRSTADRVPVNYFTNAAVHERLAHALGIAPSDNEAMLRALGVDIRSTPVRYIGPALFVAPPDRQVDPVYGHIMRWAPNRDGGYWDFCDYPLQGASSDAIDAFPVPHPDDFAYDEAVAALRRHAANGYAVHIGDAGNGDIINSTGRVMGMEETLINLYDEDEATLRYIDRRLNLQLGILERLLDRAHDDISFVWLGEDLGTQIAPMIGLDLYRRVFRPRHQRFVDLAKSYEKPVMIHTCGSSSWAYDDFVEMGIAAVDTLQPEAKDMDPRTLKDRFGDRLAFHGCISTAGPLAYGTVDDIRRTVRETLDIMMPGGGYLLSPTHAIQDNTPVENIVAMYNAAHRYGRYA